MLLKQSTARSLVVFMTASSDHLTGGTGLTLAITASKDGGAFASISPTVTELANGWYKLALTTSHTDTLGDLALHITATGADPSDLVRQVVVHLPGATVASVTARVTANTDQLAGQTVTAGAGVTFPASVASPGDAMALTSSERTTLAGVIWSVLTSALTTVGSIGKLLVDNINATISSRSTYAGSDTSGTTTLLSRLTSTRAGLLDNLDATVSSRLASGTYTAPDNAGIAAIQARTDNLPDDPADESLVVAATNAIVALLGTPAGASIAADIATRLAASSYAAPLNAAGVRTAVGLASANLDTQLSGINAKTTNLPASPAAVGDVPTAAQVADKLLGRSLAGGADGGRTVRDSLRPLRNKTAIAGGVLTVMQEDDTTAAWTASVTTAPGDPLTEIDPA